MKKILMLENGIKFTGEGFGAEREAVGEVVFNTGMTGYQELMTDPSYCGQIVVMTYPIIGSYGINDDDNESAGPHLKALITREKCILPSNFRSSMSLDEYMKIHGITGISGIDTRALTIILRSSGTMNGSITSAYTDNDESLRTAKNHLLKDPVSLVTRKEPCTYGSKRGADLCLIDFGTKSGIIRELVKRGHRVTAVPAHMDADEILSGGYDGVVLSNGPGDPKDCIYGIETAKCLIGRIPLFGICLGLQLIALALGGDTEKLKYGHRGANHPVKDTRRDRTYITSQNHGYAVKNRPFTGKNVEVTHINLNDGTIEGIECADMRMMAVQFHPEASPGPGDTSYLFDEFISMIGDIDAKEP